MQRTKIEWADSTWNPVTGCEHGCEYCYARRIAERFSGCEPVPEDDDRIRAVMNGTETGAVIELSAPLTRKMEDGKVKAAPYPFGFSPVLHRYRLNQPQNWGKPRTIFVCSMADLFGAWVPDKWIQAVFEACEQADRHRYLFLTKNPRRYSELAKAGKLPQRENFWYGSTLDSMKALRYPGRLWDNTFVSIEPLTERMEVGLGSFGSDRWVIIGAETGNRKGKVTPEKEWIDTICKAADLTQAAVFMKDSLLSVVGEANMRRELPWVVRHDS